MRPGDERKLQLAFVEIESSMVLLRTGGVTVTVPRPVQWGSMYTADPSGRSITIVTQPIPVRDEDEGVFQVTQLAPSGDTVFLKSFRYPVRRLDRAEWERRLTTSVDVIMGRFKEAERKGAVGRAFPLSASELRTALAAHYPTPLPQAPIDELRVADDGAVWLRQTSAAGAAERTWLVLYPAGSITTRVRVPDSWRLEAIVQGYVYAAATGADDIPIVVKARLVSP